MDVLGVAALENINDVFNYKRCAGNHSTAGFKTKPDHRGSSPFRQQGHKWCIMEELPGVFASELRQI